jgi:hypothetical protein
MLIFRFVMFVAMVFCGVWALYKLRKSPKFDKFCHDLETGEVDDSSSKDVIKDIKNSKDVLKKTVKDNTESAKKLNKESEDIKKFIDKEGE